MRLANLHALILLCGFVVAILVANLTSALVGTPPAVGVFALLAAFNIFVVRPRAWAWLWRRAFLRLSHAIVGQDVERALELADNLAAQATTRGTREFLVANRGIALIMGEKWKSGIAVLRGVDRGLLSPLARLIVDNDLAWGLTHDGAHDEAIAVARATAEAARADATLEPVFLGCCIGTLGTALVRANMPEPGLVHLREAHAFRRAAARQRRAPPLYRRCRRGPRPRRRSPRRLGRCGPHLARFALGPPGGRAAQVRVPRALSVAM